jgi:hypothetical protein
MRSLLFALGAAAAMVASPVLSQGRGHGQGGGQGHGQGHGNDGGQAVGERGHGGGHGGGHGRDFAPGGGGDRVRADHVRRGPQHAERLEARGRGREVAGRVRNERRAAVVADRGAVVRLTSGRRIGLINGCPPGLARKHNGCLPPGQARRLLAERPWYGTWWRHPGDGLYRYDDGYLYRLRPDGMVTGFVPLAGGALWLGNRWPATYAYDPLPPYYVDYYGYRDPYSYRYADGIVYGLDPRTETIRQIAALATGDDWGIGGRMPDGYGVYNVPYAYRDRYYDTPDDWYRYSDGYVYRVDPTTQLVEAAIRLIA